MGVRTNYSSLRVSVLLACDIACIAVAYTLACWVQSRSITLPMDVLLERWQYAVVYGVCWPVAAMRSYLYISRRRDSLLSLLFDISKGVLASLIVTGFFIAFYTPRGAEPSFISYFGLLSLGLLGLFRVVLQVLLRSLRSHGRNERQVLIVGVNERTHELVGARLDLGIACDGVHRRCQARRVRARPRRVRRRRRDRYVRAMKQGDMNERR